MATISGNKKSGKIDIDAAYKKWTDMVDNPRAIDKKNMEKIDNLLIKKGYNYKQRLALLSSIAYESGGDPFATDGKQSRGIMQWDSEEYTKDYRLGKEYFNSNMTTDEALEKQVDYLDKTLRDTTDKKSWTHGGKGSGYKSLKDAYADFFNDKATLEAVNKALVRGYVRPKNGEEETASRFKLAETLLSTGEAPKGTKIKLRAQEETATDDNNDLAAATSQEESIGKVQPPVVEQQLSQQEAAQGLSNLAMGGYFQDGGKQKQANDPASIILAPLFNAKANGKTESEPTPFISEDKSEGNKDKKPDFDIDVLPKQELYSEIDTTGYDTVPGYCAKTTRLTLEHNGIVEKDNVNSNAWTMTNALKNNNWSTVFEQDDSKYGLNKYNIDLSRLKVGDVVFFKNDAEDKTNEDAKKNGDGNRHVAPIVGFTKDGIPLVLDAGRDSDKNPIQIKVPLTSYLGIEGKKDNAGTKKDDVFYPYKMTKVLRSNDMNALDGYQANANPTPNTDYVTMNPEYVAQDTKANGKKIEAIQPESGIPSAAVSPTAPDVSELLADIQARMDSMSSNMDTADNAAEQARNNKWVLALGGLINEEIEARNEWLANHPLYEANKKGYYKNGTDEAAKAEATSGKPTKADDILTQLNIEKVSLQNNKCARGVMDVLTVNGVDKGIIPNGDAWTMLKDALSKGWVDMLGGYDPSNIDLGAVAVGDMIFLKNDSPDSTNAKAKKEGDTNRHVVVVSRIDKNGTPMVVDRNQGRTAEIPLTDYLGTRGTKDNEGKFYSYQISSIIRNPKIHGQDSYLAQGKQTPKNGIVYDAAYLANQRTAEQAIREYEANKGTSGSFESDILGSVESNPTTSIGGSTESTSSLAENTGSTETATKTETGKPAEQADTSTLAADSRLSALTDAIATEQAQAQAQAQQPSFEDSLMAQMSGSSPSAEYAASQQAINDIVASIDVEPINAAIQKMVSAWHTPKETMANGGMIYPYLKKEEGGEIDTPYIAQRDKTTVVRDTPQIDMRSAYERRYDENGKLRPEYQYKPEDELIAEEQRNYINGLNKREKVLAALDLSLTATKKTFPGALAAAAVNGASAGTDISQAIYYVVNGEYKKAFGNLGEAAISLMNPALKKVNNDAVYAYNLVRSNPSLANQWWSAYNKYGKLAENTYKASKVTNKIDAFSSFLNTLGESIFDVPYPTDTSKTPSPKELFGTK